MADEVQRYTSGKVGYVVLNNPDIYSTLRPISEQAERKLSEYNECYVKGEATDNFFAGVYADSLEYESSYQFKGWNEENLLEYILNPGQFIDDEAQRYVDSVITENGQLYGFEHELTTKDTPWLTWNALTIFPLLLF